MSRSALSGEHIASAAHGQGAYKARIACEQSGKSPGDHFGNVTKMVGIGSGAQPPAPDGHLSRYTCYLIVQNGDPAKVTALETRIRPGARTRPRGLSQ